MFLKMKKSIKILPFLLLVVSAKTQTPIYKNPTQPIEKRVADLLQKMTPAEKHWQLFMVPTNQSQPLFEGQFAEGIFGLQVGAEAQGDAGGQILNYKSTEPAAAHARKIDSLQHFFIEKTRLGIPALFFDEALHGLVRRGATAFPQAIGLAATFDTDLVGRVAGAIADECRERGIRQILSPVVNIAADPRWGRTEETYGEDPLLATRMGVAFVREFERRGIVTTPKHFVANVGDGGRDSYPIHLSERGLAERHFPPFEACFREGGSRSVMTSYNSLDGTACSANRWLLEKKLKNDWHFRGFVISDANAVGGSVVLHNTARDYPESGEQALNNGLDVIFQTDYDHHLLFFPAFENGKIAAAKIDSAVARVLRVKFELGLFDEPFVSKKYELDAARMLAHKKLAQEAARKSLVLLKNDRHTLPIPAAVKRIAVVGEEATAARLGGYSGPGNEVVSILEGIRERAGSAAEVVFERGAGLSDADFQTVAPEFLFHFENEKLAAGLQADFFVTPTSRPGTFEPPQPEGRAYKIDEKIDHSWTLFSPDPKLLAADNFAARWSGKLKSPAAGTFKIGLEGNDGFRLFLDGKLLVDRWQKISYSTQLVDFQFEKEKLYDLQVEFRETAGNARIRLIWDFGIPKNRDFGIEKAVAAARKSDFAVVVVGIHEGEFQDRSSLALPARQEDLIRAVAATGVPTAVVLVGGSAITMSRWLDRVPAVLMAWYAGEEGGRAVAAALFGDENPGGRLPLTFPLDEAQLPLSYLHLPTGRGDDYSNLSGQPLFPFGFGLSYSEFEYSDLRFDKKEIRVGDTLTVRCRVKNVGKRTGDEVVQLYLRDVLATVARPVLELKNFERVQLQADESQEIIFKITPEMMSLLDSDLQRRVEAGEFRVMVGASSRELFLKENFWVRE